MGRVKVYQISLLTVALNYAMNKELLFSHEENKPGSRNHREDLPL